MDRTKWNFVKGELNPADIPTRLSSNLVECFSGCWFEGPVMLWSQDVGSCVGRSDEISLVGREESVVPSPVVNIMQQRRVYITAKHVRSVLSLTVLVTVH